MRDGVHIGCSGWSYDDWVGTFYDSKKKMLSQYQQYFDTAEINSTFYSLPSKGFIGYLAYGMENEMLFTAKLPKVVTHENRLDLSGEGGKHLEEFYSRMSPMKSKLAALLIQLPPWPLDEMGNPEQFFSGLNHSFRYAIEFRHQSWLNDSIWKLLKKFEIAHVIVDEPKLPVNMRITTDFAYVRWHGHGFQPWYNYLYSLDQLREWVPRIQELDKQADTVLGYFNNHFAGKAPLNALQMLELMGEASNEQSRKAEKIESTLEAQTTIYNHSSTEDEISGLLLKLTDQARLDRGMKEIKNVEIQDANASLVTADIKKYKVTIDADNKIVQHDCPDYRRYKDEKRFCKHLVAVILELPEKQASSILKQITRNLGDWSFE